LKFDQDDIYCDDEYYDEEEPSEEEIKEATPDKKTPGKEENPEVPEVVKQPTPVKVVNLEDRILDNQKFEQWFSKPEPTPEAEPEPLDTQVKNQDTESEGSEDEQEFVETKSPSDLKPVNYRTILCKWFERFSKCTIEGCTYAHGQKELVYSRPSAPTIKKQSSATDKPKHEPTPMVITSEPKEVEDFDFFADSPKNFDKKPKWNPKNNPKFKTQMCRNIEMYGDCNFTGCTYAHSRKELRKMPKTFVNKYFD